LIITEIMAGIGGSIERELPTWLVVWDREAGLRRVVNSRRKYRCYALRSMLDSARAANDLADVSQALCGLAQIALYCNDLDAAWMPYGRSLRKAIRN
jgi:hypothetical protein